MIYEDKPPEYDDSTEVKEETSKAFEGLIHPTI
jgi:hypothetical protein